MKIRQGFVSNSSSSSFIVFGRNIDIKDITPSIIKEKEIICLGKELSDGQDVFYIENIDMLAFLKALNELGRDIEYDMEFIEVYSVGGFDEYSGELDLTNLTTKKIQYFNIDKDYSSSRDLSDIKGRYDDNNEAESIAKKYLRSIKINEIQKAK